MADDDVKVFGLDDEDILTYVMKGMVADGVLAGGGGECSASYQIIENGDGTQSLNLHMELRENKPERVH
ncbi:hypothetical protein [uncultured Maritimibacter sp.]|uniref:hypothetical protein n=1 Tax=uncultured Maritimibacter sp. TaxID=991866 RepID=UPI00259947E6|nr:hypothetical protein [uncultured Maritimibacter sp.]